MKPTSYLINVARGPIVDERALYETLSSRPIASAALDVFDEAPTPASNPILKLDSVIVPPTPWLGPMSSSQASPAPPSAPSSPSPPGVGRNFSSIQKRCHTRA